MAGIQNVMRDCTLEAIPRHPPLHMHFGPVTPLRHTAFFSDEASAYRYSGVKMTASPLTGWMKRLLGEAAQSFVGERFNSVLVNIYPTGSSTISAHSDADIIGTNGVVSLSYGEPRVFRIREKTPSSNNLGKVVADIQTTEGSAIWMRTSEFQNKFTHEIVRGSRTSTGPRISLTLRFFMPDL